MPITAACWSLLPQSETAGRSPSRHCQVHNSCLRANAGKSPEQLQMTLHRHLPHVPCVQAVANTTTGLSPFCNSAFVKGLMKLKWASSSRALFFSVRVGCRRGCLRRTAKIHMKYHEIVYKALKSIPDAFDEAWDRMHAEKGVGLRKLELHHPASAFQKFW